MERWLTTPQRATLRYLPRHQRDVVDDQCGVSDAAVGSTHRAELDDARARLRDAHERLSAKAEQLRHLRSLLARPLSGGSAATAIGARAVAANALFRWQRAGLLAALGAWRLAAAVWRALIALSGRGLAASARSECSTCAAVATASCELCCGLSMMTSLAPKASSCG